MKLKFAVAGASGRMGAAIKEVLVGDPEADFGLGIVRSLGGREASLAESNPAESNSAECSLSGQGARWITSEDLGGDPVQALSGIDVVIDFSTPDNLRTTVDAAVKAKVPLLVGVTGLEERHLDLFKQAAQVIPVAYAANTSLGIAVLSTLSEMAAKMLPLSFDVEILELHHKHKKDAPSGTALHLAGRVHQASDQDYSVNHSNKGSAGRVLMSSGHSASTVRVGRREGAEIGMSVIRGGDVVGEHTVYFMGDGERIELTHRCSDRGVFARGAVYLAKRLKGRSPGYYSVAELIK